MNSPHKGQWRGDLMFSLICTWINSSVSNHEAGDLRCHHAYYDVTVMCWDIGEIETSVLTFFFFYKTVISLLNVIRYFSTPVQYLIGPVSDSGVFNTLLPNFSEGTWNIFTFCVIQPHWCDTVSWNPSSNKTRIYLLYTVSIMAADVLATQGARTSATMILT